MASIPHHSAPQPSVAPDRSAGLPWWVVAGVLLTLGAILPLLVAERFGALGIPRGDDVSYLLTAFRFADHGVLNGSGWTAMNLVGQIALAWPVAVVFGHRVGALQVEVAVLGTVGLYAVYDMGRALLTPRRALFVAATTALGPLWLALAPTFLTDVPAFAFAMLSLALGLRALRRGPHATALLVASLTVGFVGFTIREYAAVAPLAVMAGAAITGDRTDRRRAVVSTFGFLAAAALFFAWRRHLDGFTEQTLAFPTRSSVEDTLTRLAQSVVQIGFVVVPAVVLAGPTVLVRRAWNRAPRATVLTVVLTVGAVLADAVLNGRSASFMEADRFVSNQWTIAPGTRPLLPTALAVGLEVVGVASFVVLLLAALPATANLVSRSWDRTRAPAASPPLVTIAAAIAGFVGAYGVNSLAGGTYFPRYLLPLVPLVSILVLASAAAERPPAPARRSLAIVALTALGVISVAAASVNASLEAGVWSVARSASRSVEDPRLIDGGFDWNGWHAGVVRPPGAPPRGACVEVTLETAPPEGARVVARRQVRSLGEDVWVVARRTAECRER